MLPPPGVTLVARKPYGILTPQRLSDIPATRRNADTRHESTKRWTKRDRLIAHSPDRNTPDV